MTYKNPCLKIDKPMKQFTFTLFLLLSLSLGSCGHRASKAMAGGGDTIPFRHASHLQVVKYPDYTIVKVRNPWDTLKTLHTYILADKNRTLPDSLPQGSVVRVPLSNALVYSSVHCSLLDDLGATPRIGGVCDLQYIYLPVIHERNRAGKIADCGNSMSPDMERVIELHPDAILLSPFENSGGYGRIEKLGVPLIECADYMETSPLGRAEWMRFFGLLTGTEARADSLFRVVEQNYLALQRKVRGVSSAPRLMVEMKNGAAWYVPAGQSTLGRMYADAGANYLFAYLQGSGSVSLSFETVLDRARHADCWLIKYNHPADLTLGKLKQEYAAYARFDAFSRRQVYGCNTGRVPFYEESPFHPDRLLADLIRIFHPQRLPGHSLRYFTPLAP